MCGRPGRPHGPALPREATTYPVSDDVHSWTEGVDRAMSSDAGTGAEDDW